MSIAKGLINVLPEHIYAFARSKADLTTLTWLTTGAKEIEIRVGAPDGKLMTHSSATGMATIGEWVKDGTVLFLQDVSGGLPLVSDNTLATTTVHVTTGEGFYPFVTYLGMRLECDRLVLIGCEIPDEVANIVPYFRYVVGFERSENIEKCQKHCGAATWIPWDTVVDEGAGLPDLNLEDTVVVCSDGIFKDLLAHGLPAQLSLLIKQAAVSVVSVFESDGEPEQSPSDQESDRSDRWNLSRLSQLLDREQLPVAFSGRTRSEASGKGSHRALAIIDHTAVSSRDNRPSKGFRVVAIMTAYNEEDIIEASINRLIQQGIDVYLIDNWSTDATHERAARFLGRGLICIEKFPAGGPVATARWGDLLRRVANVATKLDYDWVIHHDVDEVRISPWMGVSLKDGIFRVDQNGFNCIDHAVIEFCPVDNNFVPRSNFEAYFQYFKFDVRLDNYTQLKAWKNFGQQIDLDHFGGHEVRFEGRRVYPYKFLLKHYPIRSQRQGEKKVFRDRAARWEREERERGWHVQYEEIGEGHNFVKSPHGLNLFDEVMFYRDSILERLSGIRSISKVNAELSADLARLREIGSRQKQEIETLKTVELTLRNEIVRLNAIEESQKNEIAELRASEESQKNEIAELRASDDSQKNEIERLMTIESSLSWQMLKPLLKFVDEVIFPWHTRRGRAYLAVLERLSSRGMKDAEGRRLPEPQHPEPEPTAISELAGIEFPGFDRPDVSIIIPVYNQWRHTYGCLQSISDNTGVDVAYEIIIANDASTDETMDMLSNVKGVTVITNFANKGFLRNCNSAAREATGKYLLFLNNDINVTEGWLKWLFRTAERDPQVGIVGAKLVYPNGKLQEAGGIVWNDPDQLAWNYGKNDDPAKPEYNYVKEVDYCSGACLLIRKDLFDTLGGFDERYEHAYCEDTDLAFAARQAGYKVIYQPKSEITHFEGVSHGKEVFEGIKRYQPVNQRRFYDKWKTVIERDHFRNGEHVFQARDRSKYKKTILVIDHYVPHYDKDAGSKSTYQYLKLFVSMGLNVKFIGDNFARHEPYTTELGQLGIEVLCGPWYQRHWREWIAKNAAYFDFAYLHRPHISIKYIDYLKEHTKAKIIYFGHDLHSLREMRRYEIEKTEECLVSARYWDKIEREIFQKADVIYYPSHTEVDLVKKKVPGAVSRAIPLNIYDAPVAPNAPDDEQRTCITFVGGFGHPPNVDAARWLAREIFPQVKKKLPTVKLYIVGSQPSEEVTALQSNSVIVTGYVDAAELRRRYRLSKAVVAPLRYGAGVKGKIIEAMYYGVPVVTTSIGAEGLEEAQDILLRSDTAGGFAEKIISLYGSPAAWYEISQRSMQYVRDHFSAENAMAIISKDITSHEAGRSECPK